MRKLWLWCIGIVALVVVGCAGRPFEERVRPPEDVARFRRCWPTVQQSYCGGDLDGCQSTGEGVYVDPRTRGSTMSLSDARRAWLRQWGCPATTIDER